jgi:DNA-binding transcriptional LysR family regulator
MAPGETIVLRRHVSGNHEEAMRRRLPPLGALRAFEAAARLGGMTRAADELCVTHGAVSRQVRGLEAELGVALFCGPKGRLRLTAEGERLQAVLVDAFDRVARGVADVSARAEGELTVSCLGSFAMRWLIPRLPRFQAGHPHVEVRLTTTDVSSPSMPEGIDLAIRVGGPAWPRSVAVRPLFAEQAGPVLAPALARGLQQCRPADLARLTLLHTATRPESWDEWFAIRALARPLAAVSRQFEHFYFMQEAALAGLGVAVGYWHLVADDVMAGRLVAPFGFDASGRRYVALMSQHERPAARLFADWLADEVATFEAERPLPAG